MALPILKALRFSPSPIVRIVLVVLGLAACLAGQKVSATPPPGYYLVWSDEFNGDSLDLSKWFYFQGQSQNAINNSDSISVTNGDLALNMFESNGLAYAGIISTDGHFRAFYGYCEASIKFSDTNSTWSAFWLTSPNIGQYIGDPEVSGTELDICEHRYVDVSNTNVVSDWVQETLHWDGYTPGIEQSLQIDNVGSGLSTGFHTYGFTWTSNEYVWSIDDVLMNTAGSGHSGRSEPILFSTQIQYPSWAGTYPVGGFGNLPTNTAKMTVDYVRYYAPPSMLFWTGTSSANWTDSGNYMSNMVVSATNDVVFDWLSTGNFNINFSPGAAVNTLYVQEVPPMTFSGSPLTINGGIDLISAFNDASFTCPLILGTDQAWKTTGGRQINIYNTISGTGNLALSGYGIVALFGTNLSSGTTTIKGGALYVGGMATNPIVVAGGTLYGPGLVAGPVQVNAGTVSADFSSPVTISNSLTVVAGGSVTFAVNADANTSAEIVGLSNVTFGGTLVLNNAAGTFSHTNAFKLFAASNYSGSFTAFNPPTPGYELAWDTSTLTTDGTLRIAPVLPVATTNIYESRNGNTSTGANNPAFAFSGFSSTASGTKSKAPGCTSPGSCRFANSFSSGTAFSVTPTLLVGPVYNVSVTFGFLNTFPEIPNIIVAPTVSGVSSSTLPATTSVYSSGSAVSNGTYNVWLPIGDITPNTPNPTLTFTWTGGTNSGRWYVDSVKFVSVIPSPLSISNTMVGTNLVLSWANSFVLQSATNMTGPWTDVPGPIIVGPWTNTMTGDQQRFFRLRQ